jgi:hypothetical protein
VLKTSDASQRMHDVKHITQCWTRIVELSFVLASHQNNEQSWWNQN